MNRPYLNNEEARAEARSQTNAFPTPAALRARAESEDAAAVQALADSIAAHLAREWAPGAKVTATLQSQPQRVVDAVIARLAASGWRATYGDDQREGRWLAIEAA